jgi:site-specific DNA-cytosine methylase
MKLLELFAGTGSVGKVAQVLNIETTSLDRDMDADIRTDIMNWDYQSAYQPGHFDIIWASPPCTEYSCAKTIGTRDIEGSNQVVQRTLDIINYFNPRWWIIENPQSGLLKHQPMMQTLPYKDVDYCKYGMGYRKRTRLWTNIEEWNPRPLCRRDCFSMDASGKRHKEVAQRGSTKGQPNNRHKQDELYVVPKSLLIEILVKLIILNMSG